MRREAKRRFGTRIFPVVAVGLGLLLSSCSTEEKIELKDDKAKESYSVGYQFGENLKKMKTDLDAEVLSAAIQDALSGKESRLSDEEMRAAVASLQERTVAAMQASRKEQVQKNLAEGEKFLAGNKTKEGVKTTASGLQYRIIEEGEGPSPKAGDSVTVHYRGTLVDGTEFDSSYQRGEPATFPLTGVIPGWTEALQLMKKGSKWELFIPSDLAYGERGAGNRIPPNSTLIFEVELLSMNEAPKE
ncbi:MAG: FKBP-type peptidyl-prolyl cis-trans isomerase [Deltaproteobacteria bacterium]|nr:MAG: FKBP-type peptidyl-prolyl cis-trans isomerase [Deltaproteobacteria bacterium]